MNFRRVYYRRLLGLTTIGLMFVSFFAVILQINHVYGFWWDGNWDYRKMITINHTKVTGDLAGFPVLIDVLDGDLASKAQDDGDDIVFTDYSGSKLSHEIEYFNGATGKLTAWVKVPSLSSSVDTILYMYYGNSGASNQQDPSGVWDSDYVMVHHLKESSGTHSDSTVNGNAATPYNGVGQGTSGKIDGSDSFDGSDDYLRVTGASSINNVNPLTYECWVNLDTYGGAGNGRFFEKGGIRLFFAPADSVGFLQMFTVNKGQWKTSSALSIGQWHHMVITYNCSSTSNNPKIYVDGVSQSVSYYDGTTIPSGTATSDSGNDLVMANRLTVDRGFDGVMDEVRMSKTERSAAWISTEYSNQYNPSTFYTVGSEEPYSPPPPPGPWWNNNWQYRKGIIIYHYSVSTNLSNFPVLVDVLDGDLASKAQDDGDDIVFTDYSGSKLSHEIEYFNGATGKLTAWVKVSSLSSTVDTILYMYYGNSGASNQQNPSGVWDSDYVMVHHLKETSGSHSDSTVNGNTATPYNGVVQGTSGKVDGSDGFDGTDDYLRVTGASSINNVNPLTYECWVNLDTYGGSSAGRFFDKGRIRLFFASSDSVGFLQAFSTNNGQWKTSSALSTSQWHHVVVTYNYSSTSNNPKIYVDGASQTVSYYSDLTIPSGTATSDSGNDLVMANRLTTDRGFDGVMDEVRMSKTERSAAWISTEYQNQYNPSSFYVMGSEEVGSLNYPPQISNESPADGAMDAPLNPTLRADIYDSHNDSVDWVIEANTTGIWVTLNSGTLPTGNGTVSASTSNMNSYSTKYWWRINAADPLGSGNTTVRLYSFTTRPSNYPPSLSNPYPTDGATDVITNPTLSINASDFDGDLMTIIFRTNASGTWQTLGAFYNAVNGRYSQNTTNMNQFEKKYYWSVDAQDAGSGVWTNRTYSFTTAPILQLKYSTILPHGGNMLPVVGDINGDGTMEIVIRSNGQVSAIRGTDGTILWTRSYYGWCHVQLADLNNDGKMEILVAIDGSPCGLVALYGDGSEYWRRNDLGGNRVSLGPAISVADTDRDGFLEVYFVSASNAGGPITGEISAISHDGQKLRSTGPVVYYPCWGGMSMGDYDFDGEFELYVGERNVEYDPLGKGVRSWWAGNLTHRWDQIHILTSTCPPLLADVNGDGKLDIVTNAIHSGCAVISAADGSYMVDDRNIGLDSHCFGAVYDIDEDGRLELTISNGQSDSNYHGFHVRDLAGRHTDASISLPYACLWPPRFGDVTGDGKMEIIAAPGVDGSTANYDIFIYNKTFGLIARIPVTGAGCLGPALVADVDGDGLNEVVVAGCTGKVIVYDTVAPTPIPRPRTELQGYSQYLQGAAEYVPPPGPLAPILSDEEPRDKSANMPTNPTLSIRVFDYQSDSMTIVFRTNASGSWQTIGTYNGGNGIYHQSTTNMNVEGTKYYWEARVTDSTGRLTTRIYSFTTYTFNSTWWDIDWKYRKTITIDHTKVAGDVSNFPVLIELTDTGLATHAQDGGDDIVFVDYLGSKLDHEIEYFDKVTGELIAWIRIPNLFSAADTMLYMYYGNSASSNQENAAGVWGSDFIMVHHLDETSGIHYDSTSNNNDCSPQGGVAQGTSGKIDGADLFDGNDDILTKPGMLSGSIGSKYTLSVWINPVSLAGDQNPRIIELDNLILFISAGPAGPSNIVNFVSAYHRWSTNVGQWCSYSNTILTTEGWVYITVTYDGSSTTNDAMIYKNGASLSLWEWNAPSGSFNSSYQNLCIGDRPAGDRSYNGKIDEVRISTSIRSASWIQTEYSNQHDPASFYMVGSEEYLPQTAIRIEPVSTNISFGEDCIVYVNVSDVADLYAWELQINYNQTILDLTSISVVSGSLNSPTYIYYSLTDETAGHLWWAVSTTYPTTTGISYAQHAILELNFRAIGAGTSGISLYGTYLSDSALMPIPHSTVNGSISVTGTIDLAVVSISVLDHDCSIYKDDTYKNGSNYHYPVEVTIRNTGTINAGQFYVKLEVYWVTGSATESLQEILISGLSGGSSVVVNFTSLFHPTHIGFYRLIATVDNRNEVTENNEANNTLEKDNIKVTLIGDINGDGSVNILDAVVIALAWNATPSDPWWNIEADINHDQVIDIYDGTRIGIHWGETW